MVGASIVAQKFRTTVDTDPFGPAAGPPPPPVHVRGETTMPPTARSASRPTRIPELDALRGLGALAILAFHLWPATFFFGWTRVDLFFVISGYLVTSIALDQRSRPRFLRTFWIGRALRIVPAYYLLLALIVMLGISDGEPLRVDSLATHLSFTHDLPRPWSGTVSPSFPAAIQTWSLAIEVQFYLICPLVILVVGRSGVIPLALWFLVDSVAARLLGLSPAVALARGDGLALGAILAVVVDPGGAQPRRARFPSQAFALIGLVALAFLASPLIRREVASASVSGCGPLSIFAVNLVYFSLVGLILRHTNHTLLLPLRGRALGYLGRVSYGIYLYHLLIIELVARHLGPRSLATDGVAVLLSLLAAVISHEFLERPVAATWAASRPRGRRPRATAGVDPPLARRGWADPPPPAGSLARSKPHG